MTMTDEPSGTPAPLFGVQRPPQPDELSDWCDEHQRWHQRRDRPVPCSAAGCTERTDHYHGTCERHR